DPGPQRPFHGAFTGAESLGSLEHLVRAPVVQGYHGVPGPVLVHLRQREGDQVVRRPGVAPGFLRVCPRRFLPIPAFHCFGHRTNTPICVGGPTTPSSGPTATNRTV